MSWKDELIQTAENDPQSSYQFIRDLFAEVCLDNCKIKDYNYHCPRCKLTKYLKQRKEGVCK